MRTNNKLSLRELIELHTAVFEKTHLERYLETYSDLSESDILLRYLLRYKRENKQLINKFSVLITGEKDNDRSVLTEIINGFQEYCLLVKSFTNIQNLSTLENIELRENNHGYDLDHKYSMLQGYIDGIEPQIIGSIVNLEIITANQNRTKQTKCSIDKETLLTLYKENNENCKN